MQKLLLHLAKLHGGHPGAIGSELAIGLGLEVDELLFAGGGLQRGEEFFFEHGEGAIEVVEGRGVGLRMVAASSRRRWLMVEARGNPHLRIEMWGTRGCGGFEGVGVLVEESCDALGLEAGLARLARE